MSANDNRDFYGSSSVPGHFELDVDSMYNILFLSRPLSRGRDFKLELYTHPITCK